LLVEGYGLREVMATEGKGILTVFFWIKEYTFIYNFYSIGIVGTETTSNNVNEVHKVLGIEAARYIISFILSILPVIEYH